MVIMRWCAPLARHLRRARGLVFGTLVGASALTAHGQEPGLETVQFETWRQSFLQRYVADPEVAPYVEQIKLKLTLDEQSRARIDATSQFRQPLRDYLFQMVSRSRVERGRSLLVLHGDLLGDIERTYRVDREAIIAVWGMESRFGETQQANDVWSALSTSAFLNQRRRPYFENELHTLVTLWLSGRLLSEASSFDGGMGQAQFMPSAFATYAVDWDKDGRTDIWNSTTDALASIANYLRSAGWRQRQPTFEGPQPLPADGEQLLGQAMEVNELRKYGLEIRSDHPLVAKVRRPDPLNAPIILTYRNFDVFRAYNGASRYALATSILSKAISGSDFNADEWPAAPGELSIVDIGRLQALLVRLQYLEGSPDGVFGVSTWRAMNAFLTDNQRRSADYPTEQVLRAAELLCIASHEPPPSQQTENNWICAN